jgi:DNA-binding IclR family transcriptional regulator
MSGRCRIHGPQKKHKTFIPTLKSALLGAWINDRMIPSGTILRMIVNLQEKMKAVVVLGSRSGLTVQYIHVQKPVGYSPTRAISAGSVRPLLRSAMGQAILSATDPQLIPALVRRINAEERDKANLVKPAEFLAKLEKCRSDGYAYSEGAATKGSGMVAVLLATPPHQPPLALGLGGPIPLLRGRKAPFVRALREFVERHRKQMEHDWRMDPA